MANFLSKIGSAIGNAFSSLQQSAAAKASSSANPYNRSGTGVGAILKAEKSNAVQASKPSNPSTAVRDIVVTPTNASEFAVDTMEFNHNEAQLARDWQEYMSNTSHQREVEDLKAAGLNPVLAANGGAAGYSGSMASSGNSMDIAKLNAKTQLEAAKISANSAANVANIYANSANNVADKQLTSQLVGDLLRLPINLAMLK